MYYAMQCFKICTCCRMAKSSKLTHILSSACYFICGVRTLKAYPKRKKILLKFTFYIKDFIFL